MKKNILILFLLITSVAALVFFSMVSRNKNISPQTEVITAPLISPPDSLLAPVSIKALYEGKDTILFWENDKDYVALMRALEGLESHGLTPNHYHLDYLKNAKSDKIQRDKWASDAWHSAAAHIIYGKVDPLSLKTDWTSTHRAVDLTALLRTAIDTNTVQSSLEFLAPKLPTYTALRAELARLRATPEITFSEVPNGSQLKKGVTSERVKALQTRLNELSFLPDDAIIGVFDDATVSAVKAFQHSIGQDNDGIVGQTTLSVLNQSRADKIAQIRVNLDRVRWLPKTFGQKDDPSQKHVRVNIADFKATAWRNGVAERTHLVVIGKTDRVTPVFSDEIEYIVLNPWWETPTSLAVRDKLPAFQQDPSTVNRLGFQVLDRTGNLIDPATIDWNLYTKAEFPFRLRQAPGDYNALGKVKIMFPNAYSVYMHDTPTKKLFDKKQRAFSSGCIRTQNPIDLTEWLLQDTPSWDRKKIDLAVESGKETTVKLSAKIPIHVLYFTVDYCDESNIRYLYDIYNYDPDVLTALNTGPKHAMAFEVK